MNETLSIVGSGLIATGIAACAAKTPGHILWARSMTSADRAAKEISKACERLGEAHQPGNVAITTDIEELGRGSFFIEAVAEELSLKRNILKQLGEIADESAVISSTTSSLPVPVLASASGRADRFAGFHVFSPVPRMSLVELAFLPESSATTRKRALQLCEDMDKKPVEVQPTPGFVVNTLLFPYLFSAVRYVENTGSKPEDVDECMRLGAGHPMGPIALLDYIGIDIAISIGRSLDLDIPKTLIDLASLGRLGKKTKSGLLSENFYNQTKQQ